jgi:ribonuclease HIII
MPRSVKLQKEEIERLKSYVREHGLKKIPAKGEHELFRVGGMILYRSGELVYEKNADAERIIGKILETERGYDYFVGTDEAGKGEWYGPLVVECVALKPNEVDELRILGIRDSKKLTKRKLLDLGNALIGLKFTRKPLVLMPETYNGGYEKFQREGKTLNDLMAWAHARAIKDLVAELKYENLKVIIDRFDFRKTEFRLGDLDKTGIDIIQKTGGESEIPVATASVLAKYIFERQVDGLEERFGIDLRKSMPGDIPGEMLPKVAKMHFKNVRRVVG